MYAVREVHVLPYLIEDDKTGETIEIDGDMVEGAIQFLEAARKACAEAYGEDAYAMAEGLYLQAIDEAYNRQLN